MRTDATRVSLGGSAVDLCLFEDAVSRIASRAVSPDRAQLAVASINLDHIHHFGAGSAWRGTLEAAGGEGAEPGMMEWLNLVDGAPVASEARRRTGRSWPRLAGSDLIGPIMARAERDGASIGFLGGTASTHERLRSRLPREHPSLRVSGFWAPSREDLGDPVRSTALALGVRAAHTDILVVSLGKPRQELWIAEYGKLTGARVLLAFGAVVDFLAGRVSRAPSWVASHGMEWAWRLVLEPRRLARRYLLQGPMAMLRLRLLVSRDEPGSTGPWLDALEPPQPDRRGADGLFRGPDRHAEVCALVVTRNSAASIDALIADLRAQASTTRLRVVVADDASSDGTLERVRAHQDVIAVPCTGETGYAARLNSAREHAGAADTLLVVAPGVRLAPDCLSALLDRIRRSAVGATVPLVTDQDGVPIPCLLHGPTVPKRLAGRRLGLARGSLPRRPTRIERSTESYLHAHPVPGIVGTPILVRRSVAEQVGRLDERTFRAPDEGRYFDLVRATGAPIWFEPRARVIRDGNAIPAARAAPVPAHGATPGPSPTHPGTATGSVIIPAHNEASVIERALLPLVPLAESGEADIIVVCNGCTDGTAAIARRFRGVRVVEIPEASKPAALNAGDDAATAWPRLYLDADIEISVEAVRAVLDTLAAGGMLAARPAAVYNAEGAGPVVRSYYRARSRIPSLQNGLWGAGAYALSRSGHDRLGVFPALTSDDFWVDQLFVGSEKAVLDTAPVVVRTPRNLQGLLGILQRSHRGVAQITPRGPAESSTGRTLRDLARSIHGPGSAADAAVYSALALSGRLGIHRARSGSAIWERDDSSRQ
jgi:exopolysaccharide biosynthesis WecB/TagA/CpsF family protein